jgi:hypothetical protein
MVVLRVRSIGSALEQRSFSGPVTVEVFTDTEKTPASASEEAWNKMRYGSPVPVWNRPVAHVSVSEYAVAMHWLSVQFPCKTNIENEDKWLEHAAASRT